MTTRECLFVNRQLEDAQGRRDLCFYQGRYFNRNGCAAKAFLCEKVRNRQFSEKSTTAPDFAQLKYALHARAA